MNRARAKGRWGLNAAQKKGLDRGLALGLIMRNVK